MPLSKKWFDGERTALAYILIGNYQLSTQEQVNLIVEAIQDKNKLPCTVEVERGGRGRYQLVTLPLWAQHIKVGNTVTAHVTFSCYKRIGNDPTKDAVAGCL